MLGHDAKWMIYGTAWKNENTESLTNQAIESGFRAFDTAAQPNHYDEAAVKRAVTQAVERGNIHRDEIWLQTKFTPLSSQDPDRLPYDAEATITSQVRQSVQQSLHGMRVVGHDPYLDCLILHVLYPTLAETMEAWNAMSEFVPLHVRFLGLSNVNLGVLNVVYQSATIKPAVVQNRCCVQNAFDVSVRTFCTAHTITYQGYVILTGNQRLLDSPESPAVKLGMAMGLTAEEVLYVLMHSLGVTVLNGTRQAARMRRDLASLQAVEVWKEFPENLPIWQCAVQQLDSGFATLLL